MSLDVYLESTEKVKHEPQIVVRLAGANRVVSQGQWGRLFPDREPVFTPAEESNTLYHANITGNLYQMAEAAGIAATLWDGEGTASGLIEPLQAGLERLKADPDRFAEYNPSNGWGDYSGLVRFVEDYLVACVLCPDAQIRLHK